MKCPSCGSERAIRAGKVYSKHTVRQGYRCKDCRSYFVERDGFEGKHYPKRVIVQILHLYAEGLSLSKVRDFLWQHFGYKPADSTILSWVRQYGRLLWRLVRRLEPELKGPCTSTKSC